MVEKSFLAPFSGCEAPRKACTEKEKLNRIVFSGCAWAKPRGLGRGCPHPGEATGVRDGTISLPDWDVHSGYTEGEATGVREGVEPHPGISLGRELGAIAQAPFSGAYAPEKPARKKIT